MTLGQPAPHLVVSISGHGFGHVSQTAPVLNLLHQLMPQLRITVRSAVPLKHLRSRIHPPFAHMQSIGDIGMIMSSALDVSKSASVAAYRAFHENWDAQVAAEARLLSDLGADAVFSNVGYLPLAGAQMAGIANAAMCSLNWFDIYRHYAGGDAIAAQMLSGYMGADVFFRTTPGMAMESLPNLVEIAPIAALGHDRRDELDRQLRLSKDEKLVLVSMGGIDSRLPIERWPRIDGVRWLVQDSWQVDHPDAIVLESLAMDFRDLLASSDALLCKPGFGSFVEAACSGTPILYADRPDWPESPALVAWLQRNGISREIRREQLQDGNIAQELSVLWEMPPVTVPQSNGAARVAEWLLHKLSLKGG